MPGDHAGAVRYLALIEAALKSDDWSQRQRQHLRDLRRKWIVRADGLDEQFESYGTFPRCPGTEKPTTTDLIVAKWRRTFQTSPEGRKLAAERKRISQLPRDKRLRQRRWVNRDRERPSTDRDKAWRED